VHDRKTVPDSWLLACAVVLAICTRCYFASRPEIGLDDSTSADIVALPFGSMLRFITWNEPSMGLYYLLLHFWSAIAGTSPLALRIPSIVFSVAAVPAIYWLGQRLFNHSTAIAAAFLLATNATAVDYAQIIRSYSLVILLVIVSSFFFVGLMSNPKAETGNAWRYIVASTLAVYAHMHAVFTLVAQLVSARFRRSARLRTLAVSGVVIALAVLPLSLVAFGHSYSPAAWVTQIKLKWMAKVVPFLCGVPLFMKTPSAIALTLSSIALAAIGTLTAKFSLWDRMFTVNALVVPLGLCALLSLVKPAFFGEARYLLICLPFLTLLVAVGIGAFRRPLVMLSAMMVLELWQVVLRPVQYQSPTIRTCWSQATDYLFLNARPGDRVALSWKYDAWLYWYYEALRDKQHAQIRLAFPDWDHEFAVGGVYVDDSAVPAHPSAKWFESENDQGGRLWIIIDPSHDSTTEQVLASVRGLHTVTERVFPDGLRVILSDAEPSQ